MTKKLEQEILKAIMLVSGLRGLTTIDQTKKAIELKEDKITNSISYEKSKKGWIITLGIIVDPEIRTKVIAREIDSAIKQVLSKNGEKLEEVNLLVRGVK